MGVYVGYPLGYPPSLRLDVPTTGGPLTATRPFAAAERTPDALVATLRAGADERRIRTTSGAVSIE